MGLYRAFQILGYNPYHLVTAFTAGAEQCKIIREGLEAKYEGKGKPYGREEFDRWLAGHGVRESRSNHYLHLHTIHTTLLTPIPHFRATP